MWLLVLVVAAPLVFGVFRPLGARADSERIASPVTIWHATGATGLDGLGSWLAVAREPIPGPGHAAPSMAFGHVFFFTGSTAFGGIALEVEGTQKFATLAVINASGEPHRVRIAFDWQVGRYYYPVVAFLSAGLLGAWVYDHSATALAPIGSLPVPVHWGKLSPLSATLPIWTGGPLASCVEYPHAEHLRHPPSGFVIGGPILASAAVHELATEGACPGSMDSLVVPWKRYVIGAPATSPPPTTPPTTTPPTTTPPTTSPPTATTVPPTTEPPTGNRPPAFPNPFETLINTSFEYNDVGHLAAATTTITLRTPCVDPDGDALSYTWTATNGTITGTGTSATWQRVISLGRPRAGEVRVTCNDGRGGTDSAVITFS